MNMKCEAQLRFLMNTFEKCHLRATLVNPNIPLGLHEEVKKHPFLDTEKINRFKYFLRENKNKNADIICTPDLEKEIRKELPFCNYMVVNLEEYIDKIRNVYD